MKNVFKAIALLLPLFLSGCTENQTTTCYRCEIIFTSNEAQSCGYANDGEEEVRRVTVGEVCGEQSRDLLIQENTSSERLMSPCGVRYTLRGRVECR